MRKKVSEKKILRSAGLIAALIALNLLASFVHYRFDLTEEKRYSLSQPTKQILKGIDEPIRIDVFLKGDFPAGFRKLANAVDEFLAECKEQSGGRLQYNFINPLEGLNDSTAGQAIDSINYFYSIPAYILQTPSKVGDEQTQKKILPGALVHYKDSTIGINLFEGEQFLG